MEIIRNGTKAISVKKLQDNEKLPREIIERNSNEEKSYGITDFSCAIYTDYSIDRYTSFRINGEYRKINVEDSDRMYRYTLMVFLVYNGNGNLIDASYDVDIENDFKGKKVFSTHVQVPKDEYISKVTVRFIPSPVFL